MPGIPAGTHGKRLNDGTDNIYILKKVGKGRNIWLINCPFVHYSRVIYIFNKKGMTKQIHPIHWHMFYCWFLLISDFVKIIWCIFKWIRDLWKSGKFYSFSSLSSAFLKIWSLLWVNLIYRESIRTVLAAKIRKCFAVVSAKMLFQVPAPACKLDIFWWCPIQGLTWCDHAFLLGVNRPVLHCICVLIYSFI